MLFIGLYRMWERSFRIRSTARSSCSRVAVFILSLWLAVPARSQEPSVGQGRIAFSVGHYVSPAMEIFDRVGPSPAYVPRTRHGWILSLDLKFIGGRKHGLFGRLHYDKLPMGWDIDARPEDHPDVLRYHVEDLNLVLRFDRISVGVGYKATVVKRKQWAMELAGFFLRNTQSGNRVLNYSVRVIDDSTTLTIARSTGRTFPGNSIWHYSFAIGVSRVIAHKHTVGLSVFYDRPWDPIIARGDVVLFENTQYHTTLRYEQSGAIYGASLYYAFGWRKRGLPRLPREP